MLPVITIVGRPNVGKSTLFNRLTHSRDAIVADMPGVTRDRQYGEGVHEGRPFIVIDTGGIAEPDDPEMAVVTEQQVTMAIEEADALLFVVDAKAGVVNADLDIMETLRRYPDKPLFLLINKSDRFEADMVRSEFYELGLSQMHVIAATTGRGVDDLLQDIFTLFPEADTQAVLPEDDRTSIAILGRPNVGKSTLVNRLLGEDRVVVFDRPGTTRDTIAIPFDRRDEKFTLIDTAGIRKKARIKESVETFSVIKAMQAIKKADVVIYVVDAREGVTDQDMRLLNLIIQTGNALVIAFNKWDHMDEYEKEQFKQAVDRKLVFAEFVRRYFISAKYGTGVGHLYDAIAESQQALVQKFSTPELTKALLSAIEKHQPPLVKGRRVKLRYAHVGRRHPLVIVVHGKQVERLPGAYKQYLVNFYRKIFKLTGIPLAIKCVNDDNPYVDEGKSV